MLRSTKPPPGGGLPRTLRTRRHRVLVAALIEAREAAGLTQRQLSVRLKVSQSWVASIEAGQRRVDVVEFLDLCRVLKIKPLVLLREADSSLM